MKNKIVLGCFIAASMLAMPSCSDFLTENPKGKLTPENFFSNQNELDIWGIKRSDLFVGRANDVKRFAVQ